MVFPHPDSLQIDSTPGGTIRVGGDLDASTAHRLRAALDGPLAEHPRRLDLDVTRLDFCDPSGLGVLVEIRNTQPVPSQLVLHGASRQLRRLLHLTHLDTSLTLTPPGPNAGGLGAEPTHAAIRDSAHATRRQAVELRGTSRQLRASAGTVLARAVRDQQQTIDDINRWVGMPVYDHTDTPAA